MAMRLRVGRLAALLGAVSLLLGACGGSAAPGSHGSPGTAASAPAAVRPEKASIKLGLAVPAVTYAPMYLASAQNLFQKQGLSVQLVTFNGDAGVVKALISGSVDVALASLSGLTEAIGKDQPVKAFWAGYNMPIFSWWAVPGIHSFQDARGKTFSISSFGASTDFMTEYALKRAGLDPKKDVKLLPIGSSANAIAGMKAGTIQVAITSPPFTEVAKADGFHEILKMSDLIPDYPFHVFYAKESFIQQDPNTIKALLRTNAAAIAMIKADPKVAYGAVERFMKVDPKYVPGSVAEALPYWYADGRPPSAEGMKDYWAMGIEFGQYKSAWPESRWLDRRYVDTYSRWK